MEKYAAGLIDNTELGEEIEKREEAKRNYAAFPQNACHCEERSDVAIRFLAQKTSVFYTRLGEFVLR